MIVTREQYEEALRQTIESIIIKKDLYVKSACQSTTGVTSLETSKANRKGLIAI